LDIYTGIRFGGNGQYNKTQRKIIAFGVENACPRIIAGLNKGHNS